MKYLTCEPPFTTERYYPEHQKRHGRDLRERHIHRYEWAASWLKEEYDVLIAGCGSGAFDKILVRKCATVHGIDISTHAVQYAANMASEGMTYQVLPMQRVQELDMKFEACVCIEAIEHMGQRDQQAFMLGLSKVLKPGGLLLITTPEKGTCTTEHHVHEFTREEFVAFLGQYFISVEFDRAQKYGVPTNFMLARCRWPR